MIRNQTTAECLFQVHREKPFNTCRLYLGYNDHPLKQFKQERLQLTHHHNPTTTTTTPYQPTHPTKSALSVPGLLTPVPITLFGKQKLTPVPCAWSPPSSYTHVAPTHGPAIELGNRCSCAQSARQSSIDETGKRAMSLPG